MFTEYYKKKWDIRGWQSTY